jgi:hypothetical protein
LIVAYRASGGDCEHSATGQFVAAGEPVLMYPYGSELGVVETGPAQGAIVDAKTERLDQVQDGAGIGGQADHIP